MDEVQQIQRVNFTERDYQQAWQSAVVCRSGSSEESTASIRGLTVYLYCWWFRFQSWLHYNQTWIVDVCKPTNTKVISQLIADHLNQVVGKFGNKQIHCTESDLTSQDLDKFSFDLQHYLRYDAMRCDVIRYNAIRYDAIQYNAIQYNTTHDMTWHDIT